MVKVTIPGWQFDSKCDPSFRFDDVPHEYWLGGELLWGFSAIAKGVNWITKEEISKYNDEGRYRGSWVHYVTRLLDENDMPSEIAQDYMGYVDAYKAFKVDWNFKPRLIEVPLYHPVSRYGVTPDREGLILNGDPAIVELKTGAIKWQTKYQTAAQELAIRAWEENPTPRRRIAVKLNADGTYKPQEYKDPMDYERWKCAVVTAQSNENKVLVPMTSLESASRQ